MYERFNGNRETEATKENPSLGEEEGDRLCTAVGQLLAEGVQATEC